MLETKASAGSPGWSRFAAAVEARLDAGERAYGNGSFERPPLELLAEIEEELLDVAGWGYILWERLRRMSLELEEAASEEDHGNG